jgi:hypothetical protein
LFYPTPLVLLEVSDIQYRTAMMIGDGILVMSAGFLLALFFKKPYTITGSVFGLLALMGYAIHLFLLHNAP